MRTAMRCLKGVLLPIVAISFLAVPSVVAMENSCYLKAMRTDVYVRVLNASREGDRGNEIWQGRINQGEQVQIRTENGRFRLYYSNQPDERRPPMSGGNARWCDNNNTVGVP